uniref:Ycf20 n=1 Tax=Halimeda minima TaxID=170427 RepID=A0A386AZ42_9CHLO|nr:hypothetical protein Ycf20 [Halimeda minima]
MLGVLRIFSFYLGLIIGNLLRTKIAWFLIFFFEFLNFMIYSPSININKKILIIFKNLQIGILLGFFLDAFKVGS